MSPALRWLSCVFLIISFGIVFPVAASGQAKIKLVPAKQMFTVDGRALYEQYCAVCHGQSGRGDGPAARLVKKPVPDLTRLVDKDGTFRFTHVCQRIEADRSSDDQMPDWRHILKGNNPGSPGWAVLAHHNLATHIESMQEANLPK